MSTAEEVCGNGWRSQPIYYALLYNNFNLCSAFFVVCIIFLSQCKAAGNAALQAGKVSEAIAHYTKAIHLDGSKNHVYFSNRSAAYLQQGKGNHALADAKTCLHLNPQFAKGYSRKGAALHALQRYNDSIAAYTEGIEKFPSNAGLKKGLEDVTRVKTTAAAAAATAPAPTFSTPTATALYAAFPAAIIALGTKQKQARRSAHAHDEFQQDCSVARVLYYTTIRYFQTTALVDPQMTCFHGSTVEEFSRSDYLEIMEKWVLLQQQQNPDHALKNSADLKFIVDNDVYTSNLDFVQHLFAFCTSWYLRLPTQAEKDACFRHLYDILELAIKCKYAYIPEKKGEEVNNERTGKYLRDNQSGYRGIVNCLYRETKDSCDCMTLQKKEANKMVKMERCSGCHTAFLKKDMKKCDGCEMVTYCSVKCAKADWPNHKTICGVPTFAFIGDEDGTGITEAMDIMAARIAKVQLERKERLEKQKE